jgi:hypothetical protein
MGRISRSIQLAGASWRILKADKELLILPFISLIATLATGYTFARPLLDKCTSDSTGAASCDLAGGDYVLLGIMYVALAFITIFFNAALVHAANERMAGGDPGVGSAIRGAMVRVHRIFPWALISATVSVILRAIEERAGLIGRLIGAVAGIAWSLVTFLVIPVLVIEDIGVGKALKRSAEMFKRTWGENMAAQVGFGLIGFLLILPAFPVIGYGFYSGGATGVVLIAIGFAWILLVVLVLAALNGIFQTALYRYAAGEGAEAFGEAAMASAFIPRKGGGRGGPLRMPRGIAG